MPAFVFICFLVFVYLLESDHGTPPPAPAPSNGMGAPPPPPDFPPRGSSFNHPSLIALQGQQPQQQRAATLVVTKDNSDEPPTYEVIPYSTGSTACFHPSRQPTILNDTRLHVATPADLSTSSTRHSEYV
ncbi:hypothetical protein OUZ56_022710 [Daphnia magna]|uniref:Secreted protein n=1 Tax=Daphnia magna TaxID=35525 RepID=A0ABR0AXH4_9CRUS|nr:hypothetical protein OUZ56_022710 [Daphnia magna]